MVRPPRSAVFLRLSKELRAHDVLFCRDARAAWHQTSRELRCGSFAIELQLAAILGEEYCFAVGFLVRLTRRARRRLEPRLDALRVTARTFAEYREQFRREFRHAYLSEFEDLVAGDEDARERDRFRGIIAVRDGIDGLVARLRALVANAQRREATSLILFALRGQLERLVLELPEIPPATRRGFVTDSLVELAEHVDAWLRPGGADLCAVAAAGLLVLRDAVLQRVQTWYDDHPPQRRRDLDSEA